MLDCGWDRAHPFTVFWNHKNKHKLIGSAEELQPNWRGHKFSIYDPSKILYNPDDSEEDEDSQYVMSRQSTKIGSIALPSPRSHYLNAGDIHGILPVMGGIDEIRNDDDETPDTERHHFPVRDEHDWNLGIVMQVHPDHTDCYHRKTWTSKLQKLDARHCAGLRAFGPYRSEYRILEGSPGQRVYPSTPIVLIGTGAGCSFLLDFYFYVIGNDIALQNKVTIYFSTRSIGMFQWFTDITCHREYDNLYVNAHLTSNDNITYHRKPSTIQKQKSRDSKIGRMNMEQILDTASCDTHIYYCGSPSIQNIVRKLCQDRNLMYHAGHSFN